MNRAEFFRRTLGAVAAPFVGAKVVDEAGGGGPERPLAAALTADVETTYATGRNAQRQSIVVEIDAALIQSPDTAAIAEEIVADLLSTYGNRA